MSKLWNVTFPIRGKLELVVEADDEEDAIEKAWEESCIDDVTDWEPILSDGEAEEDAPEDDSERNEAKA